MEKAQKIKNKNSIIQKCKLIFINDFASFQYRQEHIQSIEKKFKFKSLFTFDYTDLQQVQLFYRQFVHKEDILLYNFSMEIYQVWNWRFLYLFLSAEMCADKYSLCRPKIAKWYSNFASKILKERVGLNSAMLNHAKNSDSSRYRMKELYRQQTLTIKTFFNSFFFAYFPANFLKAYYFKEYFLKDIQGFSQEIFKGISQKMSVGKEWALKKKCIWVFGLLESFQKIWSQCMANFQCKGNLDYVVVTPILTNSIFEDKENAAYYLTKEQQKSIKQTAKVECEVDQETVCLI